MKIALVCDDLIQYGGAERVFEALSDMFPDAPIYTSVASKQMRKKFESKGRVVITSFLQKFPFVVKLNRYYSAFILHALAFESFDFSKFDLVISSSSRYAHFIITKPQTKHVCYMHSPGRMFWEPFDYFKEENYGILKPIKKLAPWFLKYPLCYLRGLDFYKANRIDKIITNSKTSQNRIKKYYRRDSKIIYPFVDESKFKDVKTVEGDYYLVVTRLASWKKVDIAVEACTSLGLKLKVLGDGPDLKRLKSLAGNTVEFLGYLDDEKKINIMRGCKALIETQKEDFGIVTLEVMACGKPVIAFGEGGVRETVLEGVTGEFFNEQSKDSLVSVLEKFNNLRYRESDCKQRALKFSKEKFVQNIRKEILD